MIPKERCEEVLEQPNFDVPSWTCPVCFKEGTRAHWVAEHALGHMRRGENEPKKPNAQETLKPGVRPIEME